MPFLRQQSYFGLGVESTRGTAASVSAYIPCESPEWTPDVKWGQDMGLRGSPVDVYAEQVLVRDDEIDIKGMVYSDSFPNLIRAALGSVDTVAGAGPYTHTVGLLNAASVGSQPPSYTLVYFTAGEAGNGIARQFTGAQLVELSLTWAADAPLTYSAKFIANIAASVAAPTTSFSTEQFIPAWDMVASVNGAQSAVLMSGELDIKRGTEPIWTSGQQGPYRIWAGPCAVDGKVSFVVETGDQTLTDGTTRLTVPLDFKFSEETTGHYIDFHMSQAQLNAPKLNFSKDYIAVDANFKAEGNTTDAVNGGYSPIKTVTSNGQSTAY
jgi:hypothetical protein